MRSIATIARRDVSTDLAYDQSVQLMKDAARLDEVQPIRDQAEALRHYYKQRKDREMETLLAAIRLRADYEIGVRSKALDKQQGCSYSGETTTTCSTSRNKLELSGINSKLYILKAAAIPYQRAAENEKLTELLKPSEIDRFCKEAIAGQIKIKTSSAYLLQWKDDQRKAKFLEVKSKLPSTLHAGDFRELSIKTIPSDSIDLVFTDPPYDRGSIPLYGDAAREAARILKPNGSMICYCGHLILPDVLSLMTQHLSYFWIGAHVHDGGPMARMTQFGIIAGFKPLIWLIKGNKRADKQKFICDTVLVKKEKDVHPWQQAVATARHFIGGLTSELGVVVDFFAGGGTTIVAANELHRSWQAFEINEGHVAAIHERLQQ
jgi:16S rRNA G966 N2-methylase RsmD